MAALDVTPRGLSLTDLRSTNGTYLGADFRKAYVPDTTLNGAGQVVGLFQLDGYTASDITYYENQVCRMCRCKMC